MPLQPGRVKGAMTYREGDGVEIAIPPGPCSVDVTELDVTITWTDGDTHGSTAIPVADFQRYIAEGALEVH